MSTVPVHPPPTIKIRVVPTGGRLGPLFDRVSAGLRGIRKEIRFAEWIMIGQTFLVLVPLWQYYNGAGDRLRTKHYQAWQVIALASERGGDGGRRQALQDLNEDGVPLRGVEVSGAVMDSLRLERASFKWANFENANLTNASLVGATFGRGRLAGAQFINSEMQAADLSMARAAGAAFNGTALCTALFIGTDLRNARFLGAVLDGADFTGADLRGAHFLADAMPRGAVFTGANIAQIRASESFVRAALASGAVVLREAEWRVKRQADDAALRTRWSAVPSPADHLTPSLQRDCRERTRSP